MDFELLSRTTIIVSIICTVVCIGIMAGFCIWLSKHERVIRLKVFDTFHGKKKEKWVYSDDPCFEGDITNFFKWVNQYCGNYNEILFAGYRYIKK